MPAPFRRTNPKLAEMVSDYQGCIDHVQMTSVSSFSLDIEGLRKHLHTEIIGQPEPIERMLMTLRSNMGVQGRKLPLGNFLIVGPPGTGKSQIIKEIAKFTSRHYEPIDLATAGSGEAAVWRMFGVTPPYQQPGHGVFTKAIQKHTEGVVFGIEEIEKPLQQATAHGAVASESPVATCFYSLLNDGLIQSLFDGSTISASKCIFGFTTNLKYDAVSDLLAEIGELFKEGADPFKNPNVNPFDNNKISELIRQLNVLLFDNGNGFPAPLLNRFMNDIIPFNPIRNEYLPDIIIATIGRKVSEAGMSIVKGGIDMRIVNQMSDRLIKNPRRSGRDIEMEYRQSIGHALSDFSFELTGRGQSAQGATIRIFQDDTTGDPVIQAL